MAHHTELSVPSGVPLFANDFTTGQIFLFDLTDPLAPRIAARIDSVPEYRRPHSFARLKNGNVIATLQFGNGSLPGDPGGLAEFTATGQLVRTSSAADAAFPGARIRPNGVELLPAIDRAITTSMPMDDEHTAHVVQVWELSGLRVLHTIPIPPLARDSVSYYPYDARALPDGRTAMLNTYFCGLYRLSDLDSDRPRLDFVHALDRSEGCAVATVIGNYWVIPVAYGRAIVSLDVTNPMRPVEVSRLTTDSTFMPHWISADARSDRIVINSTDEGEPRVLVAHLDRNTGRLTWDERFRDAGSSQRGVSFKHRATGALPVMTHASLFGGRKRN
ncbi:MAG TPA: hypothetical protein VM939_10770 [Gemmatimonadaceae bacterium]|nr:hypothetical protein [Gemmatimonadaceae bacterium]